jgi:hypothetical protein
MAVAERLTQALAPRLRAGHSGESPIVPEDEPLPVKRIVELARSMGAMVIAE